MNRHNHPRTIDRNGKTWIAKAVSNHVRIPGFHAVDPLTVPFLDRVSVHAKIARVHRYTLAEARIQAAAHARRVRA